MSQRRSGGSSSSSPAEEMGHSYELSDHGNGNGNGKTIEPDVSEEKQKSGSIPGGLENQVRVRRLFSTAQLFMFSLTNMGLWEGMCTNMYFALYNGGPYTFAWSIFICFICVSCQAASLGEMASIQPIAGAQYHWTWHLAPPRIKRFATWMQAWLTWFGYVSLLAAVANVTIILLESLIALNQPTYVPQGWHTSLLVIAMCAVQAIMNMYAFWLIPWLEMVAGVLHICLFVVFIVVFAVMGNRHSASFVFTDRNISSGWTDQFVAFHLGSLTCVWSFTGFDGAIHMSEEVRKAKSAVPRAMFWSIFMNGLLGYAMVIAILVGMGSVEDALNSTSPIVAILQEITGSDAATTAMVTGLFVISFAINLALIASVSRLTWAWSRDGGLPRQLAYVDPKHRVPIRAVWVVTVLTCILCLLNIGSSSYIAFGAVTSLSSAALYASYAIAISSMIYARYNSKSGLKLGEWNWGRWGIYMNIVALLYTLWFGVFLPFPSTLPVTGANMNYCGPIFVFIVVFAIILWYARAKKHWQGPNITIIDFVMAHSN